MIKRLSITNFKSFVKESLVLAPCTLLAGLNSSGKSSVIQALRMHNAALSGQMPLLAGHGGLDELSSHFANPKENVTVGLHWHDGGGIKRKQKKAALMESYLATVLAA